MFVRLNKPTLFASNIYKVKFLRKYLNRNGSTETRTKILECLVDKSVLRVSGNETTEFLQGLITNDMKHFDTGSANIYSLFLNIKGRVMYDTIIYKTEENETYYIECDSQIADQLQKHLKMYKIRRKINIENLNDEMKVWAMFDPMQYKDDVDTINGRLKNKLEGFIFPCGSLNNKGSKSVNNITIYEDPRLVHLGFRILADSKTFKEDIVKYLDLSITHSENMQDYKTFRYKLGVGEGVQDLPSGKALPLECNCDYLHGVSFHKGCYIGQELTARTYHTGVVRKRLMPLVLEQIPDKRIVSDENITDESGKAIGKFRSHEGKYALGLIRIAEALKAQQLKVLNINCRLIKPVWWPQETQKETASVDGRK